MLLLNQMMTLLYSYITLTENHTDQRLVLQQPHWKPLSSANDQTAQAQGVHQTSNVNTFCMTHSWTVLNSKEDFAHFRCESSGNLIEILYRPRSAADIVQRQDFLHSAQLAISQSQFRFKIFKLFIHHFLSWSSVNINKRVIINYTSQGLLQTSAQRQIFLQAA